MIGLGSDNKVTTRPNEQCEFCNYLLGKSLISPDYQGGLGGPGGLVGPTGLGGPGGPGGPGCPGGHGGKGGQG